MQEHKAGRYRVGILTGADGAIAYEIRTADGAARLTLTRAEAAALADAIAATLPPPRPVPEFLRATPVAPAPDWGVCTECGFSDWLVNFRFWAADRRAGISRCVCGSLAVREGASPFPVRA